MFYYILTAYPLSNFIEKPKRHTNIDGLFTYCVLNIEHILVCFVSLIKLWLSSAC